MDPPLAARLGWKKITRTFNNTGTGMPNGCSRGSRDASVSRTCILVLSTSPSCTRSLFHPSLSPIRCYFTITLYDAQFRTNSLTFARARYSSNAGVHVREPHLHAAGTSFAAILITRLSSGGKHEFRSSPYFFSRSISIRGLVARHFSVSRAITRELTFFSLSFFFLIHRALVEKFFFNLDGEDPRGFIGRMQQRGLLERERNVEWLYK